MPRAGLTREAVATVAIDLVDDGGTAGFDRLTLAAVAGRAGVAVPSLYKHVSSLDDLRRLVATASVAELTRVLAAATIGRAGPDAVRAAADAIRAFAHRHPGRYAATQVAPSSDPADAQLVARADETLTVLAGVMRGFGLPDDELVDAIRMLRSAVHGFITLELGGGFGLPDDLDRSYAVLIDGVIAGVERLAA
ncbi:DNA-binding transcriptional regulator, AcrR family [Leifsonia sp. 98AMF]|uniref:TetR-like C-terminal domain-containing protein n=1 Tax=unclassified Leifsonia TaxID=2663824 RepID=UPI00087DC3B2|nr:MULTISPECIES: TetR-like C-terminal domain-containing protein [unclassified Leifsonia]SDH58635.1 DNA-binding transcriptional regulator, AcrR family [Leifsonia sp. 197AMF]SDI80572.1 DNA-binding transcriptional regulator, AcrR family [Leifsonia sp. 466MF]SDK04590.1 DNA-binding transcriptional regulator, AcrR family [Leifsonia sp. 157MF]SDN83948.1 DNA-binding transcriptional regulator, AcrR family [Leifsonia sp. 509MF]SEN23069.1 DNA-binding transcriptional regulator, AcrR family [Leifsonia sp. 